MGGGGGSLGGTDTVVYGGGGMESALKSPHKGKQNEGQGGPPPPNLWENETGKVQRKWGRGCE